MWDEQRAVVNDVLRQLELTERPVLLVFNKIDRLESAALMALQEAVAAEAPGAVFVSATAAEGLDPLKRALTAALRRERPIAEIRLAHSAGKLLAEIHRDGEVLDQRADGDQLVLRARVGERLAGRLRQAGATVLRHGARDA
jgi:GTP-binding protein HflX